jgi:hypothetical protein
MSSSGLSAFTPSVRRRCSWKLGARALTTQPPEESCEFTWDDVPFSTAYFDRQPDGSFSQPLGRFSDWLFPRLRNGRPWRQKDIDDIEILRGLETG